MEVMNDTSEFTVETLGGHEEADVWMDLYDETDGCPRALLRIM